MRVVLCRDGKEAAELVTQEILSALAAKPDLVLGLATGSTPIGVYRRLGEACQRGDASFAEVCTFNLDEYLDLPADHPQSYRAFMRQHLFAGIDLPAEQTHFPPVEGDDLVGRCEAYEEQIRRAGGIDIQLLGIGRNGHIGFNEPTSSLASRTRLKTLTRRTLDDNARFYAPGESQPGLAATMGIGTILEARRILLQALGEEKAEALRNTIERPVSSFFPASALQLHPRVQVYLDPGAASRLSMREYYRASEEAQQSLKRQGRL